MEAGGWLSGQGSSRGILLCCWLEVGWLPCCLLSTPCSVTIFGLEMVSSAVLSK